MNTLLVLCLCLAGAHGVLECQGVERAPLAAVGSCELRSASPDLQVVCSSLGHGFTLQLRVLESSGLQHCAALRRLESFPAAAEDEDEDEDEKGFWRASFSPLTAVGMLHLPAGCTKSCSVEVKLKQHIRDMAMFHFLPSDDKFWNFSDPMFQSEWMESLETHDFGFGIELLKKLDKSGLQELVVEGNKQSPRGDDLPFLGNMPRLRRLHIARGHLVDFASGNCEAAAALEDISLRDNNFQKLPVGLAACSHLQRLDMSQHRHLSLDNEVLRKLTHLTHLNLSRVDVKELRAAFLPSLPDLRQLLLSSCSVKEVEGPEPFSGFPNLETLDLSYNFITNVSQLFLQPSKLKTLNLSNNNIKWTASPLLARQDMLLLDLSFNTFATIPQINSSTIRSLNLAGNPLEGLSNPSLEGLRVEYLNLSQMQFLEGWDDPEVFVNLGPERGQPERRAWVARLNLSDDDALTFTEDMVHSLSVLAQVDLGGVEFDCSTNDTEVFRAWLRSTSTEVLSHNQSTPLNCSDTNRPILDSGADRSGSALLASLLLSLLVALAV